MSPIAHTGFPPAAEHRGINWPRLYDALLSLLTRGREDLYRTEILDLAQLTTGHHLLDIGCGTGTQALEAHRRVQPDGSVTGVDISPSMIARARRKALRRRLNIAFEQADAAALPFEDSQFDVITITTVMHMIPSDRRTLCLLEARRVLKSGGRLLIIDYAGPPEHRKHWSAKHGLHGRFDLHDLRTNLADLGFFDIRATPLHRLSLHALTGSKDEHHPHSR
jgi:ubiquinone/menaquinone biosynthesis C-methylase UbiE